MTGLIIPLHKGKGSDPTATVTEV